MSKVRIFNMVFSILAGLIVVLIIELLCKLIGTKITAHTVFFWLVALHIYHMAEDHWGKR